MRIVRTLLVAAVAAAAAVVVTLSVVHGGRRAPRHDSAAAPGEVVPPTSAAPASSAAGPERATTDHDRSPSQGPAAVRVAPVGGGSPLAAPKAFLPSPDTATPPPADLPVQQATADKLMQAWKMNDRAAASAVATNDAIDQLFVDPWSESNRFMSCADTGVGEFVCTYGRDEGILQLSVSSPAPDRWLVDAVRTTSG